MSTHKRKDTTTRPGGKPLLLFFLILAVVLAGVYLFKRGAETQDDAGSHPSDPKTPGEVDSKLATQTAEDGKTMPKPAFVPLVGRWLREDGGYVVEISEVLPDGKLKAAYFNPNPIHVSQAAAAEDGGSVKVGIELNDVNYPGCLYTLVFDPELDQLQGTYFQAAQGQTYPIVFVRIPSE